MDWQGKLKRLRQVERHIATGEKMLANARKRLERAAELGLDPNEGKKVIAGLQALQNLYLAERDLLKTALRGRAN